MNYFENDGYCPCCEKNVRFIAKSEWLRDDYLCSNCGSLPRERALMFCLEKFYPNWRELTIHESSPVFRGASKHLAEECKNYLPSFFYPDISPGTYFKGYRCENLEELTFKDESIDIHVTQDVFEHILEPGKAFKEIKRTLKGGGSHIFTVPMVNKNKQSVVRAVLTDKITIDYLKEPVFHGNPITDEGSLVTIDWGYDICDFIFKASGLFTTIVYIDNISRGIRAELIEVLITRKE